MVGGKVGGSGALEPIEQKDEILKAQEGIQETSKLIEPNNPSESISESSVVTIT